MNRLQAEAVVGMLDGFKKLERPATDEVGWVALKLSCTRAVAEKKIVQARRLLGKEDSGETAHPRPTGS